MLEIPLWSTAHWNSVILEAWTKLGVTTWPLVLHCKSLWGCLHHNNPLDGLHITIGKIVIRPSRLSTWTCHLSVSKGHNMSPSSCWWSWLCKEIAYEVSLWRMLCYAWEGFVTYGNLWGWEYRQNGSRRDTHNTVNVPPVGIMKVCKLWWASLFGCSWLSIVPLLSSADKGILGKKSEYPVDLIPVGTVADQQQTVYWFEYLLALHHRPC